MNTNSDIAATISEKIKQRSENVALTAEQRRISREAHASATENSDYFSDKFNTMKENIDIKLENAKNVNKSELMNYLDEMVEDVGKLQNFLNESSMFLAAFKIKKAQETVNLTNDLVKELIKELEPPKKFGFKNKKGGGSLSKTNKTSKIKSDAASNDLAKSNLTDQLKEQSYFGFKDCNGETLVKSSEELTDRQVNLQNLTNCKVLLLGTPSSLQVANLNNTIVIVGPTSRSAFIKNCHDCTFVLACQQVRIHDTQTTNFYLHVTGSAIIENCKNVSFGPYTLEYEGLSDHFNRSGLSLEVNQWRNIEDFHWLNENEKSPNFSLIEEEKWIKSWL